MLKVSTFQGETEHGPTVVPLFGPADSVFEKVASTTLLPGVTKYIESLRPQKDSQYVLVNAMGAEEYFGSNINGDSFPEAALIHAPDEWTGNPLLDAVRAKSWPYGYPTFYLAHPYAHHRNKDATRAFGEVELSMWHPRMKRVELVVRVDEEKCHKFGGTQVWDKLKAGGYPDVSMGTKVPFDTCSICLDWDAYRKAQATFDSKKHAHPGMAVLEVHKHQITTRGKGIRGVSITRKDYCEHASKMMNRILPDGRKVFVRNDYPRFFDISFVFIGADKTAKVMMKIADAGRMHFFMPSVDLATKLGYDESDEVLAPAFLETEKVAEVSDEELFKQAFIGKRAEIKSGEMTKNVPAQFASKAVPELTRQEEDLPRGLLHALGSLAPEKSLSTTAGLGIVLRPREFQRVILIRMGNPRLADELEDKGEVFSKSDSSQKVGLSPEDFHIPLAKLLLPFMEDRSLLGPSIERRVIVIMGRTPKDKKVSTSHSSDLLHKIGAAYNGYRDEVMDLVASAQNLIADVAGPQDHALHKLASISSDEVFTPLSFAYLRNAFVDEYGVAGQTKISQAQAGVERGLPSRNTMRASHGRSSQ